MVFIRTVGLKSSYKPGLTTDVERMAGYGKAIVEANPIGPGDLRRRCLCHPTCRAGMSIMKGLCANTRRRFIINRRGQ